MPSRSGTSASGARTVAPAGRGVNSLVVAIAAALISAIVVTLLMSTGQSRVRQPESSSSNRLGDPAAVVQQPQPSVECVQSVHPSAAPTPSCPSKKDPFPACLADEDTPEAPGTRLATVSVGPHKVEMKVREAGELVSEDILEKKVPHGPRDLQAYLLTPEAKQKGDWFLDIGSHIGSCMVMAVAAGFKVVAVEPNPQNFATVMATRRHNKWEDMVRPVPCGFGDVPDASQVFSMEGNSGHSTIGKFRGDIKYEDGQDVFVTRGDDWLAANGLDDVSFTAMKLDVEGFEARAMRGLAKLFRDEKRRPAVVASELNAVYLRKQGTSMETLLYFFNDAGYECVMDGTTTKVEPPLWKPLNVKEERPFIQADIYCVDPKQ